MRYDTRYRSTSYNFGGFLPKGVKWLLIANIGVFFLNFIVSQTGFQQVFGLLALSNRAVLEHFAVYQLVTYMFLHSTRDLWHIVFNMLSLWMFGSDLERTWGTRRFVTFYFVCGIGAGICDVLVNTLRGMNTHTIGASGAIYGLLLAFGMLFPDRIIILFIFPVKAKYLVIGLGAMEFLSSMNVNSNVSNIAHLGGMLTGYLFLRFGVKGISFAGWHRQYQAWKVQRAKRKFQVYMKKHGTDRDRWVN